MVYVDTLTVDETYTCTVNTASKEQEFIPSVNLKHEVWKFHHHTSWPDLETGRDMANHLSSESFQIILAVHFPLMVWIIVLLQNVPTFFFSLSFIFLGDVLKIKGKIFMLSQTFTLKCTHLLNFLFVLWGLHVLHKLARSSEVSLTHCAKWSRRNLRHLWLTWEYQQQSFTKMNYFVCFPWLIIPCASWFFCVR